MPGYMVRWSRNGGFARDRQPGVGKGQSLKPDSLGSELANIRQSR